MNTIHNLRSLLRENEIQDRVVNEILDAYEFFGADENEEAIESTLKVVNEYKNITKIYCARCTDDTLCEGCMPIKRQEALEKAEEILKAKKAEIEKQ